MESRELLHITHQNFQKILYARKLRRRMTLAEKCLWQALRNRKCGGHKFRRQLPLGRYVVDFACLAPRVIVEIDGSIHNHFQEYDQKRQAQLEKSGFSFLRFTNTQVLHDLQAVLKRIQTFISRC